MSEDHVDPFFGMHYLVWVGLAAMVLAMGFGEYGCSLSKEADTRREILQKCLTTPTLPYCGEALKK